MTVTLRPHQLGLVDWLYRNGDVVSREDNEDGSVYDLASRRREAARDEIESQIAPYKQRGKRP